MRMRISIRTQTMPLPDEATKLHPLDSQTKVHTTSPKDNQTLSQQDYSPFCSKPNDLQSDSESEYVSDEATTAQPLMLKNTNSQDKSHDNLLQDDRHQIAIVSQLASLKKQYICCKHKALCFCQWHCLHNHVYPTRTMHGCNTNPRSPSGSSRIN